MKVGVVGSQTFADYCNRLDASPYLSDAVYNKIQLGKVVNINLIGELVNEKGVIVSPYFKRNYITDTRYGLPMFGNTDIMRSDLSRNSEILSNKVIDKHGDSLRMSKGNIIVTCFGTVGYLAYFRKSMGNAIASTNFLRINVDEELIGSGYLYAYLSSRFGHPILVQNEQGTIVSNLLPEQVRGVMVPRFGKDTETKIDALIKDSSDLRDEFELKVNQATELLFSSAGIKDITPNDWCTSTSNQGFSVTLNSSRSLRALNFNSRYQQLVEKLKSVKHKKLGEICCGGKLSRGGRFKRIDADEEHGVRLVAQKQGFWAKPEGRWISPKYASNDVMVPDETILIAARGTLGEREVYCRAIFITGSWLDNAYSEDFLRVNVGAGIVSGAYLFAFLRSETAFRCIRSMSTGSKQQEIHTGMLSELPVPIIDEKSKAKVEALIREAFIAKDSADEKEKQAITLVEDAIAEAVK
ncbi:methylation-associated defense system restriction endonuclease subunit S MAD5 [Vibrio coralliilyticus]|uniref:methylation-associated defense system restriction endonuclease subunit S MAD5 n=1 Tax=Vibrio coralliilyticus TaxID=190893 RepID=UPI001E30A41B|nr:hypothetical protein [Vibrio coralliilyticus]MCC2523574.1 hypothetical protein [Vibrio coralliilyticus]